MGFGQDEQDREGGFALFGADPVPGCESALVRLSAFGLLRIFP
jgi:hypothetical protein